MLWALRSFETELQRRLAEDGFEDVTVAQSGLLRHLNPEGMRLGDLAADAGISKQAASQAVKLLEASRLVRVGPDPDDRRAKRVQYTRRGRALVEAAIVHIVAIEREWEVALGQRRYNAMREGLSALSSRDDVEV